MTSNKKKKIFIVSNVILYLAVSFVSTIHSIDLFKLFNPAWLAIILAAAVELGQGVSLFSLNLVTDDNKGLIKTLFGLLTFIQIMANLYYSYAYYMNNSLDSRLIEFFSPLLAMVGINDGNAIRLFTFLFAGLLPVIAILFIEILIKYIVLKKVSESIDIKNNEPIIKTLTEDSVKTSNGNSDKKSDIEVHLFDTKIDKKNTVKPLFTAPGNGAAKKSDSSKELNLDSKPKKPFEKNTFTQNLTTDTIDAPVITAPSNDTQYSSVFNRLGSKMVTLVILFE